jgi:hypothetical protein
VEEADTSTFEVPVSVGKGVYLSARRGTLTITNGELILRTRKTGDVIAQAPIDDVWAAKGLDAVKVWIGGKRFLLRPGKGAVRATGHFTVAYAAHATAKQFKQFQTFATAVLAAAKTEGAHIGKPE